jgi:putative phosphoesterase
MKLVILSDSHDNIWALDQATATIGQADAVIHCGDLCSPFMIPRLAQAAHGRKVHIVWGNNDGDKRLLMVQANKAGNVEIHGEIAELNLGGLQIAVNHYPEVGRALSKSGQYDLVCYGHDHAAHEEWVGNTLLLNPGEVMGLMGRRSLVLLETEERRINWIDLV